MRKFFALKGILLPFMLSMVCSSTTAQFLTFTQTMDSLLAPLDKNRVTTGILYERVKPLANIDLFNITSSDPFISENSYFRQAYLELYNSTYNTSGWLKPKELRDWVDAENLEKKYNIGIMDYQFNMIDSNAVQHGLLTFSNGQFHDVSGAASPFYTRRLQVASMLIDEIPSGVVALRYNSNFFKTNQNVQINNITLNFGSVGTYILSPSNPIVLVNFTGSGTISFNVTVQYTNGSSFSNASEIQIGSTSNPYSRILGNPPAPNDSLWISSKYPFQGYEETQPFYGKAKISIWWKLDANEVPVPGISKPIIIVDGFDPLDIRLNKDIYDVFSYAEVINGVTVTQDFAKELRRAGFDIIVMDMPAYSQTSEATYNDPTNSLPYPNILPAAAKGIVYGGGDYIQRNAYTLEYLIDYANLKLQQNNSTEKLVVVGPSMGGQITRYALRDMEIRGQSHNCRLWVSFDSPHEGAYVPLGLQFSISELATASNNEAAIRVRDLWINCPAAQQMTLHQYKSNSETVAGVPNFFNPYYNEINNSIGFPQATGLRKIAMLNGSDLGVSQTFGTACQLATKFKVSFKPRGFLGYVTLLFASNYSLLAYAISPLQNHKTYLAPATGQCTIFGFNNDFGGDYTKKAIAPAWSNTSLDLIQGGFLPSFKLYKEQTEGQRPKKWYKDLLVTKVDDYVINGAHELTYSTLAVGLGNMPDPTRKWDANFRLDKFNQPVDVTCPETKESPFDMYWAPDINTRHDSLLLGHVIRLRREIIDKQAWQKTQIQRQGSIQSNKSSLCNGETASLSMTQPLTGLTYNWTTSNPYIQITSGQGTSSITILVTASVGGNHTISCEASSACYIINSNFTIHVGGYSSSDYPVSGPSSACKNTYVYFSTNTLPGATDYAWFWPLNNWTYVSGNHTPYLTLITGSSIGGNTVGVRVANACDAGGSPGMKFVQVNNCGGWRYTVSPNPTRGNIVISVIQDEKKTMKRNSPIRIYHLKILDQLGNINKQYSYPGGIVTTSISTLNLPAGVYIIQAYNGTAWDAIKFIKQ